MPIREALQKVIGGTNADYLSRGSSSNMRSASTDGFSSLGGKIHVTLALELARILKSALLGADRKSRGTFSTLKTTNEDRTSFLREGKALNKEKR